jgi:hypothetical protein
MVFPPITTLLDCGPSDVRIEFEYAPRLDREPAGDRATFDDVDTLRLTVKVDTRRPSRVIVTSPKGDIAWYRLPTHVGPGDTVSFGPPTFA